MFAKRFEISEKGRHNSLARGVKTWILRDLTRNRTECVVCNANQNTKLRATTFRGFSCWNRRMALLRPSPFHTTAAPPVYEPQSVWRQVPKMLVRKVQAGCSVGQHTVMLLK